MKLKNNWFNNLLFPGGEIMYPLLSFLCLFFFFVFFGGVKEYTVTHRPLPSWTHWYILAFLGYFFCSIWGIYKKWWHLRFLVIGAMIILFSFYRQHNYLYKGLYNLYILWGLTTSISTCCIIRFHKNNLVGKILWALPIFVISFYNLFGHSLGFLSCVVALIVLAVLDTNQQKYVKATTTFGIVLFYILTTLTYSRYNPLLHYWYHIKTISISFKDRNSIAIAEQDDKYITIDGITGSKLIDMEFDCYRKIEQYNRTFVGFKSYKYKDYESDEISSQIEQTLYPISLSDSCAYFPADIEIYKCLEDFKTSKNETNRLTAIIFNDFMELYQKNDSTNLNKLKTHQFALQKEIERNTFDSLLFHNDSINNETILRDFSKNISLGMFNALCSDLTINNDINSALRIFSFQFFSTYFDSPIYNYIENTFNGEINLYEGKKISKHTSFRFSAKDLKREDTFKLWMEMVSISIASAELYISETTSRDHAQAITQRKQTPTIKQYATELQRFLYQCVDRDYIPDYNSFFINRFREITPMVPIYKKSISIQDYIKLGLYLNLLEKNTL